MKIKYYSNKSKNLKFSLFMSLLMFSCFSCSSQRGYPQYSDQYNNRDNNRGQYYNRQPQQRYDNRSNDPYYSNPSANSKSYNNPYEFYYPKYDRDAYYTSPTNTSYYSDNNSSYESSR